MICNYCKDTVDMLAYRLGESMCLDCAQSAFYHKLENGNQVLMTKKRLLA